MDVFNPWTGKVHRTVKEDDVESIVSQVDAARIAQKKWAAQPLPERIKVIKNFVSWIQSHVDEAARIQMDETGKPISQCRNELNALPGRIDFFTDHVERVLQDRHVRDEEGSSTREEISREPLGVIGNISAWNYPWFVGTNVFIPALLVGNAVMYKSSEYCPGIGEFLTKAFEESGLPNFVFNHIIGGAEQGKALLSTNLDGVFFTGSEGTGVKIAELTAPGLTTLGMELGGKDPAYVHLDVDVKKTAANLADGAFYNCGQSCCAVERIYVHESVYDEFVDAFVEVVRGFKSGNPENPDTYIGPLCRKEQLDFLAEQVEDALSRGGRLVEGGSRASGPGWNFEPTVFTNVNHEMDLMRRESFGPIIGIQKVRDESEAVELMNDTTYGLTASVFSKEEDTAREILRQLQVGNAYWNCCDRVSAFLPWTGRRRSGIGSTLGEPGIEVFTAPKSWHLRAH